MNTIRLRQAVIAIATAGMIGVPAGCQSTPAADTAPAAASQDAKADSSVTLENLFEFMTYRYQYYEDVTKLANDSEVIVSGVVVRYSAGPANFPNDPPVSPNVIMTVAVDDTYKGEDKATVDVLLPQGPREIQDYQESLPPGSRLGLYLYPVTESMKKDLEQSAAGRELWLPASPQGLIVDQSESGEAKVVFPMDGDLAGQRGSIRSLMPKA